MLRELLASRLSEPLRQIEAIGGGSINDTYRVQTSHSQYFCKINREDQLPGLFRSEAAGLNFLRHQEMMRIPEIIGQFESNGMQVLILEWIENGRPTPLFWKDFGRSLAQLHHVTHTHFGWEEDNYVGSVPQQNHFTDEWVSFFIQFRLQPLVKACLQKKLLPPADTAAIEKIYLLAPSIFESEAPSLLHGDLWSGNYMCDDKEKPVLIDPAVYFGHRSVDLAMTTLFGGFDAAFYDVYNYYFPFPANYKDQWAICNLYPLLIHLLLFGSSYRKQIMEITRRFE